MLAASISFAVMNLSGKIVGEGSSGMTALLIRSAATFLFVLPVMVLSGSSILGPRPGLLLLRSLLGTTALACLFISLTKLSTADATILRETAPLFVMLLAPLWLGERVSRAMVAAAVVGFTGVILVLKPWSGLLQIHALIGLLGGFFASLVMMVLRLMRGTYPAHVIVLTFGLGGVLVGIAGGGHHGLGQLPQAIYPWVVTLGVAGTCGQLFLTHAYRYAPASSISPLSLTTVIWAALGEWIISGLIPDIFSMIGFMLVTAGVVSVPFLTPSSKTPT
jgi:drug/metabolite transporter (DMT)-like permease